MDAQTNNHILGLGYGPVWEGWVSENKKYLVKYCFLEGSPLDWEVNRHRATNGRGDVLRKNMVSTKKEFYSRDCRS